MRRIFGRYGVVAAALLAMATWSGSSFGREKDSSNESQSKASSDDSQNASQNNNDRRNQDRDQSDADAQHHAALGISVVDNDGRVASSPFCRAVPRPGLAFRLATKSAVSMINGFGLPKD